MMYFILSGVIYLIVWGFDFKYDYDPMTWVWFITGILFVVIGFILNLKRQKETMRGKE